MPQINFKKYKTLLWMVIILFAAILLGFFVQIFVYLLPTERMESHAKESIGQYTAEGDYFNITGKSTGLLDNYTDTLMIGTAVYDGPENAVDKALQNYRYTDGVSPSRSLIAFTKGNRDSLEKQEYPNYWHGYLIVLKPLLLFFNYGEIRPINIIVQFFLLTAVLMGMAKKRFTPYILPFMASYLFIMPVAVMLSLQFSSISYCSLLSMLAILYGNEFFTRHKLYPLVFLITGICASFFDLLTYPLLSFCMPFIVYCFVNSCGSWKDILKRILSSGFSWCLGYAGMWIGKWIVSSLYLRENMILAGIKRVLYRSIGENSATISSPKTAFDAMQTLVRDNTPFLLFFILIFAFYIISFLLSKPSYQNVLKNMAPFLFAALLPFLWITAVSQHSTIHIFFVYRIFVAFIFGVLCALVKARGSAYPFWVQRNSTRDG